jgi:hypothetical protein
MLVTICEYRENGRSIEDEKCKNHAKSVKLGRLDMFVCVCVCVCVCMKECIVCLQIRRLFLSPMRET